MTPAEENALLRDVAEIKMLLRRLVPADQEIKTLAEGAIERSLKKLRGYDNAVPDGHHDNQSG